MLKVTKYDFLLGQWVEAGTYSGVCLAIFHDRKGRLMILIETDSGEFLHTEIAKFKIKEVSKN